MTDGGSGACFCTPERGLATAVLRAADERLARLWAAATTGRSGPSTSAITSRCTLLPFDLHDELDAQDALQSTFASAFAALRRAQRDAPLRPWLFRIAHNEAMSLIVGAAPTVELRGRPEPWGDSVEDSRGAGALLRCWWGPGRVARSSALRVRHARAQRPLARGDRGRPRDVGRGREAGRLRGAPFVDGVRGGALIACREEVRRVVSDAAAARRRPPGACAPPRLPGCAGFAAAIETAAPTCALFARRCRGRRRRCPARAFARCRLGPRWRRWGDRAWLPAPAGKTAGAALVTKAGNRRRDRRGGYGGRRGRTRSHHRKLTQGGTAAAQCGAASTAASGAGGAAPAGAQAGGRAAGHAKKTRHATTSKQRSRNRSASGRRQNRHHAPGGDLESADRSPPGQSRAGCPRGGRQHRLHSGSTADPADRRRLAGCRSANRRRTKRLGTPGSRHRIGPCDGVGPGRHGDGQGARRQRERFRCPAAAPPYHCRARAQPCRCRMAALRSRSRAQAPRHRSPMAALLSRSRARARRFPCPTGPLSRWAALPRFTSPGWGPCSDRSTARALARAPRRITGTVCPDVHRARALSQ